MKRINPKTNLLEHSEAKIILYSKYLAVYLNIMHRAQFARRIFIFDLFCGEGIYENNVKGSPIITLDVIRNHYFSNQQNIPDMTIWFNDNGMSEIKPGVSKIDRVKAFSSQNFVPENVKVEFYKEDFEDIYPKAIQLVEQTSDAKGLFFVDPFGYKAIKPIDLWKMLESRKSEVFLWLPIAQMYRFADAAMRSGFPGSEPLKIFLLELFGRVLPPFHSPYDFIEQLKARFREYFKDIKVLVDTFVLERDASNMYCLFFFTQSIRGYEKILESKWSMDPGRGKGHTVEKTFSLFNEIELSGYPQKLYSFIDSADYRTNEEIFLFGLENGFLPKHTKGELDKWKNADSSFEVVSLDDKPVRGFYLAYNSDRHVGFRFKK